MKSSHRPVFPPVVFLCVLFAAGILQSSVPADAAPPVFDKPGVHYHPGVKKCAGCHTGSPKEYRVPRPVDALCYRCHVRKDTKKLVHGPLGSGECTACHDPHGSKHRALAVASPEVLCTLCHDQASSGKHMKQSRGKRCTSCHDPHASDKSYLRK